MKETIKFPKEEAREIIYGDHPDFETIKEQIVGQRRWCVEKKWIGKRKDGKFFTVKYDEGATENQDEGPFEYDKEVVFTEVFAVEKTIVVYE